MRIRRLKDDGDWAFGKGLSSYNFEDAAIGEDIQTKLKSFLNDCWFDQEFGVDWFRLLGTKGTRDEIKLTVRSVILRVEGVVRVNEISALFDGVTRSLTIQYNVDTIYSQGYANTVEVA